LLSQRRVEKSRVEQSRAETSSVSEEQKPPQSVSRKKTATDDDGFLAFWKVYPRRTHRLEAFKAWMKLKPSPELLERILAAVKVQSRSPEWNRDKRRYVPHAATWLNGARWEDEVEKAPDDDRSNNPAVRHGARLY